VRLHAPGGAAALKSSAIMAACYLTIGVIQWVLGRRSICIAVPSII
jgi:hypothetical protein